MCGDDWRGESVDPCGDLLRHMRGNTENQVTCYHLNWLISFLAAKYLQKTN